MYIDLATQIH